MSERDRYEPGVPCWVETLQPDPSAAMAFYGKLFGWEFDGPGAMVEGAGGYFVARLGGSEVAGMGCQPTALSGSPAAWTTQVRVESADGLAEQVSAAGGSVLAGPLDAAPAGRLVVLADPAGAVLCAWEADAREGAQRVNEPGAWSMSVLNTPDPESAASFYGAVFGWRSEPLDPHNGISLWRLPGYVGGEPQQPVPRDVVAVMAPLAGNGSGPVAPAHWAIDFWVHDADEVAARAAAAGGRVVVAPHDIPIFRQAVLSDPWGAVFSVSQLMLA